MRKVLVAGATGYLGQFVVKALKARGYWVRALGRNAAKLAPVEEYADDADFKRGVEAQGKKCCVLGAGDALTV